MAWYNTGRGARNEFPKCEIGADMRTSQPGSWLFQEKVGRGGIFYATLPFDGATMFIAHLDF